MSNLDHAHKLSGADILMVIVSLIISVVFGIFIYCHPEFITGDKLLSLIAAEISLVIAAVSIVSTDRFILIQKSDNDYINLYKKISKSICRYRCGKQICGRQILKNYMLWVYIEIVAFLMTKVFILTATDVFERALAWAISAFIFLMIFISVFRVERTIWKNMNLSQN